MGRFGVALPAGTTLDARSSGFLCVISDLSTFRRPFVTSSPRLSSAKTAPMPPEGAAAGAAPDGGGGGGGGGAPAAPVFLLPNGTPYRTHERDTYLLSPVVHTLGFQTNPVVWNSMTYLRSSSNNPNHALTHSTCFVSLPKHQYRLESSRLDSNTYFSLYSLMILFP